MKVECVCGRWHDVTPTGLALIVFSYQRGDLHRQTRTGPSPICMAEAFKDKELVEKFVRRYPGNIVSIKVRLPGGGIPNARTAEDETGSTPEGDEYSPEGEEGSFVETGAGAEGSQEAGSEAR